MGTSRWYNVFGRVAPGASAVILGAVLVVGGIDAESLPGAGKYHKAVKVAIEGVPYRIGQWVGTDVDTPIEAVKLLRPNEILHRRFVNTTTNETVALLVVHCTDTNDMLGHYPPQCYPAHGWRREGTQQTTLEFEDQLYPATEYEFNRMVQGREQRMSVFSFFVLPDGSIVADMKGLKSASGRKSASQLGAAQVQIVGGEDLPAEKRREIVHEFVRAIEPTIRVVAEGIKNG